MLFNVKAIARLTILPVQRMFSSGALHIAHKESGFFEQQQFISSIHITWLLFPNISTHIMTIKTTIVEIPQQNPQAHDQRRTKRADALYIIHTKCQARDYVKIVSGISIRASVKANKKPQIPKKKRK
jgi:hypothetical protein